MQLYKDFLKEREDVELLYTDKWYAKYKFTQIDNVDVMYIIDIFVAKPHRRNRHGFEIGDLCTKIAKEKGINVLIGSVAPTLKGATESMQGLIQYGFKLFSIDNNLVYLKKEI